MRARKSSNLPTSIAEQLQQLRAIFYCVADGIIILDMEGKVVSYNRVAVDCLALSGGDFVGQRIEELPINEAFLKAFEELSGLGEPTDIEIFVDPGSKIYKIWKSPLIDDQERRLGTLYVVSDITKLKTLEKLRRDFVANVSHELKTPITSIKGFVETLLDGAKDDPEALERFLKIVLVQSDRMVSIIEDLLTMARLESEKVEDLLVMQDARISEILQSAEIFCRPKAEEKNIRIESFCADDLIAYVDRSLMEQAVINLIDNAIKYSESDKVVQVRAERDNQWVIIYVTDQGWGIPEKHIPRLFERFYRVDKARSRQMGGTGLGLAIVKHVASVHKGSISIKSKVGEGSTFKIMIPKEPQF